MARDEPNPGLEDVIVAETRLSRVDGEAGELIVGGFPLEELAPNAALASRRSIPDGSETGREWTPIDRR